jgi:hypothetical protein
VSELTPNQNTPTDLTAHLTRSERPETMGQALAWDRRRDAYAYRAGLCDRDAAALSWGHSLGFASLPDGPCEDCAPIVTTFPVETSHPSWRAHPRGRVSRPSGRPTSLARVLGCPATVGTFCEPLPVSS